MEARKRNPALYLVLSALAAALMTSIKVTMLPLCLPLAIPWAWVAWERLGMSKTLILGSCTTVALIPASFAPIAALCILHTGTWSGNPNNRHNIEVTHPLAGLIGNGLDFAIGSLTPPIFPGSKNFGEILAGVTENSKPIAWTKSHYPSYHSPQLAEMPSEEGAGIGIGITILCILWFAASSPQRGITISTEKKIGYWTCGATLVAALVFMAKVGGNCSPRLMLPFTPFFVLTVLLISRRSGHDLPKHRLMLLPALLILPALGLNPNRPLLPVEWVTTALPGLPGSLRSRIDKVYGIYSKRGDILAPMAAKLPPNATVGFAGELDHSPMGLFRPFGSRRVVEVTPDSVGKIEWIVGTARGIKQRLGSSAEEWAARENFALAAEVPLTSKASTGEENWQLYQRKH